MKAILVVDVPIEMLNCNTCVTITSLHSGMSFNAKLKPMPERYEGNLEDYEVGWNDALEEIEDV